MAHDLSLGDKVTSVRRNFVGSFVLIQLVVIELSDEGFIAEYEPDDQSRFTWKDLGHTVHKYDPDSPTKPGYWWAKSETFKSRLIIEVVLDYRGLMVWVMGKHFKYAWDRFNRLFKVTDLEFIGDTTPHYWDYL